MRGIESALGFVLFFAIFLGFFYITSITHFSYLLVMDHAQKEMMFNHLMQASVQYYGYCDDSNFLRVYYSGGVPEYSMRLVCVNYRIYKKDLVVPEAGVICLVPRKGSGAKVVDVVYPPTNPLQNPIEYNIQACSPSDVWAEACKKGEIVCYALGKVRAYPFIPIKQA